MSVSRFKTFYKRNLPHIHNPISRYFITFRLANSLPRIVVENLRNEYKSKLATIAQSDHAAKFNAQQQYFQKFDQFLDYSTNGNHRLDQREVADGVAESIRFLDGSSYDLICFTIMSNHVHLLIDHSFEHSGKNISDILQSLKKYTARQSNKILDRTGTQFWQNESYDHIVKDDPETENVIRYILLNPVKVGLCAEWQNWRWTYLKEKYRKHFL